MEGDARACVVRLFREHGSELVARLYRLTRNRADAIELAQETYLRMLQIKDWTAIHSPKGYMFTVGHNLAVELVTRPSRTRVTVDISDPVVADELSHEPGFAERIDDAISASRLGEVLAELPLRCRNAFWLYHVYGMSYEEIARHFGVSRETIKKDLSKAMLHCRQRLEPPDDEPTEAPDDEPTV